jgi:hypothetical protein
MDCWKDDRPGNESNQIPLRFVHTHRDLYEAGFMDPYALNEETPKAVCALNSKGEKKEEKEEGRRKKEKGKRETTRERP